MSAIVWIVYLVLLSGFSFAEEGKGGAEGPPPVVLWHGYGDHCCNAKSVGKLKKLIEEAIPGIYVLSLMIGIDAETDKKNSMYMNTYKQLDYACKQINGDSQLQKGYNAIGLSQGALLLRALAQKCPSPQMHNLISFGGPQQGIYGFKVVNIVTWIINLIARYTPITRWRWLREKEIPLQYWHDPTNEKKYRKQNHFIVDMNNENDPINEDYKLNLMKLHRLVLVKFTLDKDVVPADSAWFQYYTPGQSKNIQPLEESRLWVDDRLGLKKMDGEGKLHRLQIPSAHLRIPDHWFIDNIINIYLK